MKKGDKVKVEVPEGSLPERIQEIAYIRQVIKSATIRELENKELTFLEVSPINTDWAIVRTQEGKEYELHMEYLKEIE